MVLLDSDDHNAHPKKDTVAAIESTNRRRMEKKHPASHHDAFSTLTVVHQNGISGTSRSPIRTGPSERQLRMRTILRPCPLMKKDANESHLVRDEPCSFRAVMR